MAGIPIRPTRTQEADLAALATLDLSTLDRVLKRLQASKSFTIAATTLKGVVSGELDPEHAAAVTRSLLTFATIARQNGMSATDAVAGLTRGLEALGWEADQLAAWRDRAPVFERLLDDRVVRMTAKAFDLSYDFTNFCISSRIVTDIRPVFDDDDVNIIGAVVAQTLRLDYANREGHVSLSVALDADDIARILKDCTRASSKASAALDIIRRHIGEGFIAGEERYGRI